MLFVSKIKFNNNSQKLYSICKELIENYEKETSLPSCMNDLMLYIKNDVKASKNEVAHWNLDTSEYIMIANKLLANGSFDLLVSGIYHIYYGVLNPMSCASNLMSVYDNSMQYALKNEIIDEKTKKEQKEYLIKCISEVG